jgi:hypothetical protein
VTGLLTWRSCANRLRRVSYTYNLAGLLNINTFMALAARLLTFGARAESSSRPPPR